MHCDNYILSCPVVAPPAPLSSTIDDTVDNDNAQVSDDFSQSPETEICDGVEVRTMHRDCTLPRHPHSLYCTAHSYTMFRALSSTRLGLMGHHRYQSTYGDQLIQEKRYLVSAFEAEVKNILVIDSQMFLRRNRLAIFHQFCASTIFGRRVVQALIRYDDVSQPKTSEWTRCEARIQKEQQRAL